MNFKLIVESMNIKFLKKADSVKDQFFINV